MIVERMKNGKRFVRYKEGAEMYSMCQSKFEQMAKDAKATMGGLFFCDRFELSDEDVVAIYEKSYR